MKVLSVKNPYGYLICSNQKKIEYRKWNTTYRGQIYIHTSKNNEFDVDLELEIESLDSQKDKNLISIIKKIISQGGIFNQCIIGTVDIIDTKKTKNGYEWILKNGKFLENPIINIRGKVGIFDYEAK